MTPFEEYFGGRLFCINCAHRTDRWEHAQAQFAKFGLTTVQRFDAHTGVIVHDQVNNNAGCTASHRALLEIIAFNRWPRAFIFEDDFEIIYEDFHDRWARYIKDVPADWDMIYLGAGYGEPPVARVSPHVIRAARLLTTSSYGITWQHARKIAPYISGIGPIDSLYGGFHRDARTYIFQPRLVVQYPNFSDLQGREMDNSQSMLDRAHESTV